jgi:hypothetical protein
MAAALTAEAMKRCLGEKRGKTSAAESTHSRAMTGHSASALDIRYDREESARSRQLIRMGLDYN